MQVKRSEILPGVWLSYLQSDKFKTACLSLSLLTQLKRETASLNALIPFVLRRGTTRYEDMEALSSRMDELYGAVIEPVVRRIGEIQCLGFYASIPEDDFLPAGTRVLPAACELLGELLLSPATRGGLLRQAYVESEREKLVERIRARVNDKIGYALSRCLEEMCCFEDFSVSRYGSEESAAAIYYTKLTKHYRALLQTSPIEIFYCGRAEEPTLVAALREALATLPRGEVDYDIGTDVRLNAIEAQPRFAEEHMDVAQGKLVMGFRLGESMEEPDPAVLTVFNCLYGGGTTSKLFMNVREKLQLCYYASSLLDWHKGLLLVNAGIEPGRFEEARDEILAQLDALRRGEISDEELQAARAAVASDLRSLTDSQGELEGFTLSQTIDGLDYGPMELAALCEEVGKEELIAVAKNVECDMIYYLSGEEDEDDADDDAAL